MHACVECMCLQQRVAAPGGDAMAALMAVCTSINQLTAKHKEDVLQTVVRLNGGKGNMSMAAAVSKKLSKNYFWRIGIPQHC
eukprot:1154104-Pelagomonas_calceolata.AAC.2